MSTSIEQPNSLAQAIASVQAAQNSGSQNGAGSHNEQGSMHLPGLGVQSEPSPANRVSSAGSPVAPTVVSPNPDVAAALEGEWAGLTPEAQRAVWAANVRELAAVQPLAVRNGSLGRIGGLADAPEPQFRLLKGDYPFMWAETEPLQGELVLQAESDLPMCVKMRLQCDAGRLRAMLQGYSLRELSAYTKAKRGRKAIPTVIDVKQHGFYYVVLDNEETFAQWAGRVLREYLLAVCPTEMEALAVGLQTNNCTAPNYVLTECVDGQYIWQRGGPMVALQVIT